MPPKSLSRLSSLSTSLRAKLFSLEKIDKPLSERSPGKGGADFKFLATTRKLFASLAVAALLIPAASTSLQAAACVNTDEPSTPQDSAPLGSDWQFGNFKHWRQFTAVNSGTVDNVKLYVVTAGASNFIVGVYADSGTNTPTTKIGETAITASIASGIQTIPLVSQISVTAGTKYWITFEMDTDGQRFGLRGPAVNARTSSGGTLALPGTAPATNAYTSDVQVSLEVCAILPPPEITGLSTNLSPLSGTANVIITGTDFTGATSVSFNGINSGNFTVDSDTQITADAPPNSAGAGRVIVTTPDGTNTDVAADDFSYSGAIVVTSAGDVSANDGVCTCREAVLNANFDSVSYTTPGECGKGSGADTIDIQSLDITTASVIQIQGNGLTISGSGAGTASFTSGGTGIFSTVGTSPFVHFYGFSIKNISSASSGNLGINHAVGALTLTAMAFTNLQTTDNFSVAGALGVYSAASLSVVDSSFAGNSVVAAQFGAAIYANTSGAITIRRSTFSGNSGSDTVRIGSTGIVNFENNTVSTNTGNGINIENNSNVVILNSTIANNTLAGVTTSGTLPASQIKNSVLWGNNGAGFDIDETFSTLVSGGYNVIQSPGNFTMAGSDITTDPLLGPLANNGGPTFTHAIGTAGSAVDRAGMTGFPATDQRGIARPFGADADSGAFELNAMPPVIGAFSPADLSVITNDSPVVSASVTDSDGVDPASITVTVDGLAVAHAFDGVTVSHSASSLAVGPHTVTITAADTLADPSTATWIFYYYAVPAVTGLSVNSAALSGTTGVVITGTGFTGATSVSFNGINSTNFSVDSDTQITADAPPNAAGSGRVIVTNPGGSSTDVAADDFSYAGNIVVTSTGDVSADDGLCTCREAVIAANTDTPSGTTSGECGAGTGADIIELPAGTIVLTQLAPIDIQTNLTISGAGTGVTIIDGNKATRTQTSLTVLLNATTMQRFTVDNSLGQGSNGGAIFIGASGTLTLDDMVISNSDATAGGSGGGVYNDGGNLTVKNSTIIGNTTSGSGGGIYVTAGILTVEDSRIAGNLAASFGGGVVAANAAPSTLTLTRCDIDGNTASAGGGLWIHGGSSLTLTGSTVAGNQASSNSGGGLNIQNATVTLQSSTFSGNSTAVDGGGLHADITGSGSTITNSTFSNNTASGNGGGLHFFGANLTLLNSTITGNTGTGGEGLHLDAGGWSGVLTLSNSIVYGNGTLDISDAGVNGTSGNYNVIGVNSGFVTVAQDISADPMLGPLADNGGPTLTHFPQGGSSAIDHVLSGAPATDQRGIARPVGPNADAGAVELDNVAPVLSGGPFSIVENSAKGAVVGAVGHFDAEGNTLSFRIVAGNGYLALAINAATGQITVNDPRKLDYEKLQSFNITVRATDNGEGSLFSDLVYTINLTDDLTETGSGYFGSGQAFNILNGMQRGAMGDLDGDGILDIYSPADDPNPYTLWKNTAGTFGQITQTSPFVISPSGSPDPRGSALGDLDADGDLDAFIAVGGSVGPKVFKNDGSGDMAAFGAALTGHSSTSNLALGDLDGDGDLDAYVIDFSIAHKIWLNDGNGAFSTGGSGLPTQAAQSVALADLDNDGDLDVILGHESGTVNLFRNDGSANLTPWFSLGAGFGRGSDIAVGDINKDGYLDFVVARTFTGGKADELYINNAGTAFTLTTFGTVTAGSNSVELEDLNADGNLDLVIGTDENSSDEIWLGDGAGVFTKTTQVFPLTSTNHIHTADVDGDGDIDLVEARQSDTNSVYVWLNDTTPPVAAALYPSNGSIINTTTPPIRASFSDSESGIDPVALTLTVDAIDLSAGLTVSVTADSIGAIIPSASALAPGLHEAILTVSDQAGNTTAFTWNFTVAAGSSPKFEVGPGSAFATVPEALAALAQITGGGAFTAPVEIILAPSALVGAIDINGFIVGQPSLANPLILKPLGVPGSVTLTGSGTLPALRIRNITDVTFDGFFVNGSGDGGVSVENSSRIRISRNSISGSTVGISVNGGSEVVVTGNLVVNSSASGISLNNSADVRVNVNTVANSTVSNFAFAGTATGSKLSANVSWFGSNGVHVSGANATRLVEAKENIYYSASGTPEFYFNGGPFDFATYKAASGMEQNSQYIDPKLRNPGTTNPDDYLPVFGSPLINGASTAYDLAVDWYGTTRNPDVGFGEFVSNAPTFEDFGPLPGAIVTAAPMISATAKDNSGSGLVASSISTTVNGVGYPYIYDAVGGGVTLTAGPAYVDGQSYTVAMQVADNDGQTGTAQWSFLYDSSVNAAIYISLPNTSSPAYTSQSGQVVVTFAWNNFPVNPVTFDTDVIGLATTKRTDIFSTPSGVTTVVLTVQNPASENIRSIRVAGFDAGSANDNVSIPFAVYVDNTIPVLNVQGPADLDVVTTASPLVWATALDPVNLGTSGINVSSVAMTLDMMAVSGTASYSNLNDVSLSHTAVALSDGPHTVTVTANDRSGNAAAPLAWKFYVDTSFPTVEPHPVDLSITAGNSNETIWAVITDPVKDGYLTDINLASISFTVDALDLSASTLSPAPTSIRGGTAWSVTLSPDVVLSNGPHAITLTVSDNAGNVTVFPWTIFVDDVLPVADTVVPAANSLTNGASALGVPVIAVELRDPVTDGYASSVDFSTVVVDVDGTQFSFPGAAFTGGPSGGWITLTAATVTGLALADVTHTVTVTGQDIANNDFLVTWDFYLDTGSITIDPVYPAANSMTPAAQAGIWAVLTDASPFTSGTGVELGSITMTVDGAYTASSIAVEVLNPANANGFTENALSITLTPDVSLVDGLHSVSVTASDKAGNETQLAWSFWVDTLTPTVDVLSPPDLTITADVNFPVAFSYTESGTGLASVSFTVDSVLVPIWTSDGTSITATVAAFSDGFHDVSATVIDNAGNSVSVYWQFWVDTLNPTATGFAPADLALTPSANPIVSAVLGDPLNPTYASGINFASVSMVVDTIGYTFDNDGQSVSITAALNLLDGPHFVTVTGKDNAANPFLETWKFWVDTLTPTVDVLAPVDLSITATQSPLIAFSLTESGTGVASVSFTVDTISDPAWSDDLGATGGSVTITPTLALGTDGYHNVSATVIDGAGNSVSVAWKFAVDTQAPDFMAFSPAAPFTVTDTATPVIGATLFDIDLDGYQSGPNPAAVTVRAFVNNAWSADLAFDRNGSAITVTAAAMAALSLTNTVVTFEATGMDIAGNLTQVAWVVSIDTSIPSFTQEFPLDLTETADAGTRVWIDLDDLMDFPSGIVPASLTATVNGPGYSQNFGAGSLVANYGPTALTIVASTPVPDPGNLPDGLFDVHVFAADAIGNTNSVQWSFLVDATAPTRTAIFPLEMQWMNSGNVSVTADFFDGGSGIDLATDTLFLDGPSVAVTDNGNSNSVHFEHLAVGLADGFHFVTATVKDDVGNQSSGIWMFGVDTVFPTITPLQIFNSNNPLAPASFPVPAPVLGVPTVNNGIYVNDSTPVLWAGTDDDRSGVVTAWGSATHSWVGAGVDASAADGSSISHTAATLADGPHQLTFTVVDAATNTTAALIAFTVDTTAPTYITDPQQGFEGGLRFLTITVDVSDAISGVYSTYMPGAVGPGAGNVGAPGPDFGKMSLYHQGPTDPSPVFVTSPNITLPLAGPVNPIAPLSTLIEYRTDELQVGLHKLIIASSDMVTNTRAFTWTFAVDDTPPQVSITNPSNTAIVRGTVDVHFAVSESVTRVAAAYTNGTVSELDWIYFDGAWRSSLGAVLTGSRMDWDTTLIPSGPYSLTATAYDGLGAENDAAFVNVIVDNDPPVFGAFNLDGITIGTTNASLQVGISDVHTAVNGSLAAISVDGVVVATTLSNTAMVANVSDLGVGAHNVVATAADMAGNTAVSSTWTFTVTPDQAIPTITNGAPVGVTDNVNTLISATLADTGGSGINASTIFMRLDGSVVAHGFAGGVVSFTGSGLSQGDHTVSVDVDDNAGNTANQLVWQFTIAPLDPTPPVASSPSPNGLTNNVNTLITAALSDIGGSVDSTSVSVTVDGVPVAAMTDGVTVTFTAASLAEGVHSVTVDLADMAGNQATQLAWNFTIDTVSPFVAINNPSTGDIVSGTITIEAGAANGVTVVAFTANAIEFAYVTFDGNNWRDSSNAVIEGPRATLDTTVYADGALVLDANGEDAMGNPTSAVAQIVTVDNTAPVVDSIDTYNGGTIYTRAGESVELFMSYTENNPAQVQVYIDDIGNAVAPGNPDSLSVGLDVDAAEDTYDVTVTMTDRAGATGDLTVSGLIVVDNTPPEITNGTPLGVTPSGTVVLSAALSDSGGSDIDQGTVVMTVDGTVVGSTTDGVTVDYTAAGLADGLHTVTVDAYDISGNKANQLVYSFTVDTTSPAVAITNPSQGSWHRGNAVLQVVAADGTTVVAFYDGSTEIGYVTFDGSTWRNSAGAAITGAWITWDTTLSADGTVSLNASAWDAMGNQSNAPTVPVQVDNTMPVAALTAPLPGSPVYVKDGDTVVISATATEANAVQIAGILHVPSLPVDEITFVTPYSITSGQLSVDVPEGSAEGSYGVTFFVEDAAGNQLDVTNSASVIVDNTIPVISNGWPTNVTPLSTVVITAALSDMGGSSIDASSVSMTVDGVVVAHTTDGVTVTYTATALVDGPHTVTVDVLDRSGNKANQLVFAFTVDTTSPGLAITNPSAGAHLIGTVSIQAAAADGTTVVAFFDGATYIDHVTFDGATWRNNVGTAISGAWVNWNTVPAGDGAHALNATAWDAMGNSINAPVVNVTVDNTAPTAAISAPVTATQVSTTAGGTVDVTYAYVEANPTSVTITVSNGAGTVIGQRIITGSLTANDTRTDSVAIFAGAAEGVYQVDIEVRDLAGSISAPAPSVTSVVIDNTIPTITNPVPTYTTPSATVVLSAALADLGGSGLDHSSLVMTVDGSIVIHSFTSGTVDFTTPALSDGLHTVTVDVWDMSGNQATQLVYSFTVDTTSGALAITNPSENSHVRGVINVEAAAAGGTTVVAFYDGTLEIDYITHDGSTWLNSAGGIITGAVINWDTSTSTEGSTNINATAWDAMGNSIDAATVTVTVDNTVPVPTVNPPTQTQYEAQTITGTVLEVNLMSLKVNGIVATLGGSAPNWTYSAVIPLVVGMNGITVTAADYAGNVASVFEGVVHDPNAPLTFTNPMAAQSLSATVSVEFTAPDATNRVEIMVSNDSGATWYSFATPAVVGFTTLPPATGWKQSWNTVNDGLADSNGTYQVRAIAYDEYNNVLSTTTVTGLTVDNTAPTLSWTTLPAPAVVGADLEVYQQTVNLKGTTADVGVGVSNVVIWHQNPAGNHLNSSPLTQPVATDGTFSRSLTLIDGANVITVTSWDALGAATTVVTTVTYRQPSTASQVCSSGGTVATADGTSIVIPSGALVSCVDVTIAVIPKTLLAVPQSASLTLAGNAREIQPGGLVLQDMAVLTLPYTAADLDFNQDGTADVAAGSLKVLYWDGSVWQQTQPDSIDQVAMRVVVRVNHFGTYVLASSSAGEISAAKVFLTKNPFKFGTNNPTSFVFELPSAGTVTLKIYDTSGSLVRTLAEDLAQPSGRVTLAWDGRGDFGDYVGSGVYIYKFTAEMSGSTFEQTKAIGVIK